MTTLITKPTVDTVMLKIDIPEEVIPIRSRESKDASAMLITVGVPVILNLSEYFFAFGKKLAPDIILQLEEYDFWLVMCAFSVHVKKGYVVKLIEFGVDLNLAEFVPSGAQILSSSIKPGKYLLPDNSIGPIAYDMQPLRIVDTVDEKQSLVLSPEFEFQNLKASLFEASLELEYSYIYPKVIGYGKRESKPIWLFKPGDNDAVEEGTKEIRMVVRAPKGLPVHGKLHINGEGKGFIFPKKIDAFYRPDFYF